MGVAHRKRATKAEGEGYETDILGFSTLGIASGRLLLGPNKRAFETNLLLLRGWISAVCQRCKVPALLSLQANPAPDGLLLSSHASYWDITNRQMSVKEARRGGATDPKDRVILAAFYSGFVTAILGALGIT